MARLTGPLLAVLLFWQLGVAAVLAAGIAAEMWMIYAIWRSKHTNAASERKETPARQYSKLLLSPEVLHVMIASGILLAVFSRGLWEIAPGLAASEYGSDLAGFGVVMAAFGTGILAGVLASIFFARRWDYTKSAFMFLSLAAVGMAGSGAAASQTSAAVFFLMLGASHSWSATASNAEITARSPESLRAGSIGGYVALAALSVSAGSFAGGWAANTWGIGRVHLAAAAVLAASAVWNAGKLARNKRQAKPDLSL